MEVIPKEHKRYFIDDTTNKQENLQHKYPLERTASQPG